MYQFKHALVEDISNATFSRDSDAGGYFVPDSNIVFCVLGLNSQPYIKPEETKRWFYKTRKTIYEPIAEEVKHVLISSTTERKDAISKTSLVNLDLRKNDMERFSRLLDTCMNKILLTPKLHNKSSIRHFNSDLADTLLEEVERGKIDLVDATLLFLTDVDKPRSVLVSFDNGVNEVAFRYDIPYHDTRIRKQLPFNFTDPWGKRVDSYRPG